MVIGQVSSPYTASQVQQYYLTSFAASQIKNIPDCLASSTKSSSVSSVMTECLNLFVEEARPAESTTDLWMSQNSV